MADEKKIVRPNLMRWNDDFGHKVLSYVSEYAFEEYADAAESRISALEEQVEGMRKVLEFVNQEWSHNAPSDCYATGPRTGDMMQDYVACPGCEVQRRIDASLSSSPEVKG